MTVVSVISGGSDLSVSPTVLYLNGDHGSAGNLITFLSLQFLFSFIVEHGRSQPAVPRAMDAQEVQCHSRK